MSKCGYRTCNYNSKSNGVCGKHKRWAYIGDESFNNSMQILKEMLIAYHTEAEKLEKNGIDILQIQKYCTERGLVDNINTPLVPSHFKKLARLLNKTPKQIKKLQKKHDPQLVYNVYVRMNHSIGGIIGKTKKCECAYCSLGE